MRFTTFSIVGCFLGTLLLFSLWPDQDRLPLATRSAAQEPPVALTVSQGDSIEERTAQTRNRLENAIVDVEYDGVPFSDVLQDLRSSPGMEIYLDDSSELKLQTPVSMRLKSVRLSMALELLLRQYNSQYIVRDGLVLIASVDEMAELGPEIRVYNCRDLVGNDGQSMEYGSDSIATPDEDPTADAESKKAPSKSERLTALIKSVVSTTVWEEVGNSIVVFDGLLVANCTPMVHQQIEQLLSELRKVSNAAAQPSINDSPK